MADAFAIIAASDLSGELKADLVRYLTLEKDAARRDEVLKLVAKFVALDADGARSFEDSLRDIVGGAEKGYAALRAKAMKKMKESDDEKRREAGIAAAKDIINGIH